ncbi:MAG: histidine kinase dimerization/phospho-acceptor domain-containing protein, partial [Pseudorhodoplanes sp.]
MAANDDNLGSLHTPFLRVSPSAVTAVVATALAVLLVLVALGDLSFAHALAGFAAIAFAAFVAHTVAAKIPAHSLAATDTQHFDVALLDALVAALPDSTIVLDGDGRVLAFNAPAGAIAPALRRGEPVSLALRTPELVEAIRRAATSGRSERVEFSERVPSDRWSEAFVNPIAASAGMDAGTPLLMVTFHDLTSIRRVEEMRADFVANASHELRTPLASLSGFIETLQGSAREDPAARER